MPNHTSKEGQSIVEAVVMVAIVMLLVTGLIVGTTRSVRNSRFSSTKGPAIKYAQEGLEIARSLRDNSWTSFLSRKDAPGPSWCVDESGTFTGAGSAPEDCTVNIDNTYTRSITFAWDGTRMTVTSHVEWQDGANRHSSELTTYFTQWR